MQNPENKRLVYEFGRFVLDPEEKTLFVDGAPVHLPAKEFETLLLLVENCGKALSKEEMMAAVWADTFVEESNLAKYVSKLRKLLETNGQNFIETIPKHGYRFNADVRLSVSADAEPVVIEKRTVKRLKIAIDEEDENPPLLPEAGQATGEKRRNNFWRYLSIFVLLGAFGVSVYFWFGREVKPPKKIVAIKSVAVLPFKSVKAEDADEYLRLGLTDSLISKLSGLKQIVVRPTGAVRNYAAADPLIAGRELRVDAVLDGNVVRVEQQIRVSVQLISVSDGKVLWGGRFDEKFTDIFKVQDAISEQVARALAPGLSGDEKGALAKHHTTNPDAHRAYVRGRFFWNRRTEDGLKEAIKYFNEAIEKDPNYALAFAGLADAYSLLADYNAAQPAEAYEKAKSAALKALELDDNLAEAHTSLAYVKMYYYWDWQGVESGYKRAIELNPNYATAHQWYSEYLTAMGRFDEALAEIRRAREIDPLSPSINAGEVWVLYFARRYDEAIEQGRKIAEINPEFAEIHEYLKRCYDQKGMYREAINARQTRRRLAGRDATETKALKTAASAVNPQNYWRARLQQEIEDARSESFENYDMAEISAQIGEKEQAFEWLEKAYQKHDYELIYLKVAPNLDPLRSDPKFADLLRRVNLTHF